jgi:hypothetical protein
MHVHVQVGGSSWQQRYSAALARVQAMPGTAQAPLHRRSCCPAADAGCASAGLRNSFQPHLVDPGGRRPVCSSQTAVLTSTRSLEQVWFNNTFVAVPPAVPGAEAYVQPCVPQCSAAVSSVNGGFFHLHQAVSGTRSAGGPRNTASMWPRACAGRQAGAVGGAHGGSSVGYLDVQLGGCKQQLVGGGVPHRHRRRPLPRSQGEAAGSRVVRGHPLERTRVLRHRQSTLCSLCCLRCHRMLGFVHGSSACTRRAPRACSCLEGQQPMAACLYACGLALKCEFSGSPRRPQKEVG